MNRVAGILAASCGLVASTVLAASAHASEAPDATAGRAAAVDTGRGQPATAARSSDLAGLTATAATAAAVADEDITLCSLDGSRPGRNLSAFGALQAALTDPANFGTGGVVEAPVTLASPTATATAADLAGCDVFFFADDPRFSAAEVSDLADAVRAGMVLIGDGDSGSAGGVHALAQALDGSSAAASNTCQNAAAGGVVGTADNPATNGPFGDLRGDSFATSPSSTVTPATGEVATSCNGTTVRMVIPPGSLGTGSGLAMLGGDPSALDLFTNSATGVFYNPTNLALYLNAVAAAAPPAAPTADDLLADLLAKVTGVGPGTSLADKVTRAQDALAAGDTAGTCDVLHAFVNQVEAISGKKVGDALAAELIADAEAIRALLGC